MVVLSGGITQDAVCLSDYVTPLRSVVFDGSVWLPSLEAIRKGSPDPQGNATA